MLGYIALTIIVISFSIVVYSMYQTTNIKIDNITEN